MALANRRSFLMRSLPRNAAALAGWIRVVSGSSNFCSVWPTVVNSTAAEPAMRLS
ncbi:hypothetical protein OV079_07800 [Nannocystis pusilla]|uniref:Uncharacterized protein n=1 Tax=Nannocystis pusilla TaxID=889268 RepID=A0A9X3EKS6_9BACT|nr:hypothetical protein [Nannocystis pusilla]MCY1005476.1 hypothetical protein [Nannocystis pusilla]